MYIAIVQQDCLICLSAYLFIRTICIVMIESDEKESVSELNFIWNSFINMCTCIARINSNYGDAHCYLFKNPEIHASSNIMDLFCLQAMSQHPMRRKLMIRYSKEAHNNRSCEQIGQKNISKSPINSQQLLSGQKQRWKKITLTNSGGRIT